MALSTKLILFTGPLLLLVLTAIAGYAYSNISSLSLPIPKALAIFTIFLPLFFALSAVTIYYLLKRKGSTLTLPILLLLALQLIFETVITTLALTHILPPSSLTCRLHDRWQDLFKVKDAVKIRAIQDALNCCGLNSVVDMAWPFAVNGKTSTCSQRFGRKEFCLPAWRGSEQRNAGVLVAVALVVFAVKVLSLTSLFAPQAWTRSRWGRAFKPIAATMDEEDQGEDARASMRRLIEESAHDEGYRDVPSEDEERVLEEPEEQGPRVVPAANGEHRNEWRDEIGGIFS